MSNKIIGNRRGEVINIDDPAKAGRVKINVFGVYDDLPEDAIPWALYSDPFMGGNDDVGGFIVPDLGNHVWVFFEEGDPEQPVYFAGAPARPDGPLEATTRGTYPYNKVLKTKSGHTIELDDTEDDTRIRIAHNSGSQRIWTHDGDIEEQITGSITVVIEDNANIHVKGNATEFIDGDVIRQIKGSVTESIMGDYTTSINGSRKEQSNGGSQYITTKKLTLSGSKVDLNQKGGAAIEVVDGEFMYSLEYAYTYEAAKDLVEVAGSHAPFDEPSDQPLKDEAMAGGDFPPEETSDEPDEEVDVEETDVESKPVDGCPTLESNVYATKIGGRGLTVRSLTLNSYFKHKIVAQNGHSVESIVCNMHHLAVQAIDPILEAFPNLRINSGFRAGTTTSQHGKGMACDLQLKSGGSSTAYKKILEFIAANVDFDQCIIEYGKSYWIHISYDRTKSKQRNQRLTYRNKKYTSGWRI